ncbi:hypothetical protein [Burkholderia gladioli]|uniref:hypothetical protein n=1 Tax=Burkholderia gladioli TaxID=28095 RepID=UPI001FC822B7|nr:hypothetical protein [Burkholderia gladioli]
MPKIEISESVERKAKIQSVLSRVASREISASAAADDLISVVDPQYGSAPAMEEHRVKAKAWLERILLAEPVISLRALSDRCIGLADLSGPINSEIGTFAGKLRWLATGREFAETS